MRTFKRIYLFFGLMACLTAGCSGHSNSPNADDNQASDATGSSLILTASDMEALPILARSYSASKDVWAGFNPLEHPAVIVFKTAQNKVRAALAINFPTLALLGEVKVLDSAGAPFSVVQVTNPSTALKVKMEAVENFDFTADISGVSTYLISVSDDDSFTQVGRLDFGQYFIHEMFHRYQITTFNIIDADQSLETYPFSSDNLYLAMLEHHALKAAIDASTAEQRTLATRHFAAIRLARRSAEQRVALDDAQETMEGSARYMEHKIAGNDESVSNNENSFGTLLLTDSFEEIAQVKDYFGFGRFYAAGAALVEITRRAGVPEFQSKIENGTSVASVLTDFLGLSEVDKNLLEQAKKSYDAAGELKAIADKLAAKAATELSESEFGNDGDEEDGNSGAGTDITAEQMACLEAAGYSLESGRGIPQDVYDECILSK